MSDLVLDASAGVDLLLDTPAGRRLQELLPSGATWWVPEHYFIEVAGALRRAELHGSVPSTRVSRAMDSLAAAPVRRVQVRPLLADAWSRRSNLTIGDAIYIVLAEHLGAALVTSDIKLSNAPTLRVQTIHP